MRTTSAERSRAAVTTSPPLPTAATTSTSGRSPSKSSRVPRKTSLSSTSTIRIGRGTRRSLFGREQQRIVRLPALLHVHLERRVSLREPLEQAVERRALGAGEEREQLPPRLEQALDDGRGHVGEVRPAGDGLAGRQPEPFAPADREAVQAHVARGDRQLAGGDGGGGLAHLLGVHGGVARA